MKTGILLEYGKKIIEENPQIIESRKIINIYDLKFYIELEKIVKEHTIDKSDNFDNKYYITEEYIKSNIKNLVDILEINDDIKSIINRNNIEIVHRYHKSEDNYNLGWHFDNKKLIIQNMKNKDKLHNLEIIDIIDQKIYALFRKGENPIYTMIIYFDTYKKDFIGGELELIDYIYLPKKGDLIIFDSRELHRVNYLKSVTRRCIVIKFY